MTQSNRDPLTGELKPPRGMPADEKKRWREITSSFPANFFSNADAGPLAAYVRALATEERAAETLRAEGFTVSTEGGGTKPHPCIAIQRGAAQTIATLSVKLRISKSARSRPDAAAVEAKKGGARPPPHLWRGRDPKTGEDLYVTPAQAKAEAEFYRRNPGARYNPFTGKSDLDTADDQPKENES